MADVDADAPGAALPALYAQLDTLLEQISAAEPARCTDEQLLQAAATHERCARRMAVLNDAAIVEIFDREAHRLTGCTTRQMFLTHELRITDPMLRMTRMEKLARFTAMTGERRDPEYPNISDAAHRGDLGPAHVNAVIEVLAKLPHALPHDTKLAAEQTMAEISVDLTPSEIITAGGRLLAHLDPDGELTDDHDRTRRRNLWLNRQDAQKMSKLTGHLDPATRAMLEVVLNAWGAPGMNNPSDPHSPAGHPDTADADQLHEAADRDSRSSSQRHHDALAAFLRAGLDAGILGTTHRGLPATVVIKADLKDLQSRTGSGSTATGTVLPISEVIDALARDGVDPYLAVFRDHDAVPLYLGRAKRLASRGQRLASFAAPGGHACSFPGCGQPAARVEMHHAVRDWADGGRTDIDQLAPACPKHNRIVGRTPGQYTTGKVTDGPGKGRTWWRRNPAPGAAPNPEQINLLPDIKQTFIQNLDATRSEIHGPQPNPPDDIPDSILPVGDSDIERELAKLLDEFLAESGST
ncbi:hypothetical protein M2359_001036 [Gordonia amarae]|nr:HNH endonuclease signature motif containing protein [Gordonia amarae]MCS3877407.1 hypothetical protein [Gordonia amarae]